MNKLLELFRKKRTDEQSEFSSSVSPSVSPSRSSSFFIPSKAFPTDNNTAKVFEEISKMKEDIKKNESLTKETHYIAVFGFFALALVVIGIALGYFEFIYNPQRENNKYVERSVKLEYIVNYQDQRILDLEKENQKLSRILDCLKYSKYWEYKECFDQ